MNTIPPIAALEIGTTRTVLCVGEALENGTIRITGLGQIPSSGVRKGQLCNIRQAVVSIDSVLKKAESESNASIANTLMAISGVHVCDNTFSGIWQPPTHTVQETDVDAVLEEAQIMQEKMLNPSDRTELLSVQQSYTVDNQSGIIDPRAMQCNVLKLNILCVHGATNRIKDAVKAAQTAKLEISNVVFAGACAAKAVLTPEQKQNGALVIDLGGGSTSYVAYHDNIIIAAGSIGVGGDHVTNDIAIAFSISNTQAEQLKCTEGSAMLDAQSHNGRITVPLSSPGFDKQSISRKALHTVINARMDELFHIIVDILNEKGVLHHLTEGVILTGGGAYLKRVTDLCQKTMGLDCRLGVPHAIEGIEKIDQPAALATICGLIMYGREQYTDASLFSPLRKFWRSIFK